MCILIENESANLEKGKSNVIGELTSEDYRQFQFSNEAMFSRQQQPQVRGPCGWASSAPACSNACYILGWPYYTYWYASGTCCCS